MANSAVANPSIRQRTRSAFTLLELILALSLTVVIVLTITMAINLYWRQFDIRRTNVEEAQLARALLRHMGDDLRSAMQYTPADLTGLQAVSQNSGAAGAAAAAAGLGGDLSGEDSGDDSATGGSDSSSGSPDGNQGSATGGFTGGESDPAVAEDGTTAITVGLYGSVNELRMDVSRLPRVDQYDALLAADGSVNAVEIPSDVKTVTYFLRSEQSADAADTTLGAAMPVESAMTGRGRGLMRREVDRATSAWAAQAGGVTTSPVQARLLAEEVVGLSFQYFDGTQWLPDWDSDQYGGLPLAVEILLVLSDADPDATDSSLQADTTTDGTAPTERTYRLVVHLPTATIPTTDPMAASMEGAGAEPMPMEAMP